MHRRFVLRGRISGNETFRGVLGIETVHRKGPLSPRADSSRHAKLGLGQMETFIVVAGFLFCAAILYFTFRWPKNPE